MSIYTVMGGTPITLDFIKSIYRAFSEHDAIDLFSKEHGSVRVISVELI